MSLSGWESFQCKPPWSFGDREGQESSEGNTFYVATIYN